MKKGMRVWRVDAVVGVSVTPSSVYSWTSTDERVTVEGEREKEREGERNRERRPPPAGAVHSSSTIP